MKKMDQNAINQQHDSLKLEKAYTFFMVPFYYDDDDWKIIHKERLNKWIPISSELYKEDVLYPYIMDLFKHESPSQKARLNIYEFKSEDKGVNSQLFVERVLGKKSIALIGKNAEEKQCPMMIEFRLMNEGNFAPHLFISPTAKIGIFTFSIELLGDKSLEDLNALNYYLHKRNELDKYQCICFRPDKQKGTNFEIDKDSINSQIPNLWKLNQWNTRKNVDFVCWNLNDFVDCLLATMGLSKEGQKRIKYFSKYRMHLFTFCSMEDNDDNLKKEDITRSLLQLSRCINKKHVLPLEQLVQQEAILQTYENIYFSSSIEGTAMLCIANNINSKFIKQIHARFNRQYLLIYLLVLIQRYTLQSIERKISEIESTDKQSDEDLWDLLDVICRVKVNCYYTDVSVYTHHSQFYQHCCKNLHIPETFKEISEKTELIKLTTDRHIKELMEAQSKIHEEELESAERRQHILNWIVAILTIAQVMQAAYELLKPEWDKDMSSIWISLGIGAIFAVLLFLLMWKDIKDFFSKLFK